jgi:hypothetical protein
MVLLMLLAISHGLFAWEISRLGARSVSSSGTIFLSGRIRKRPEKSMKSDTFHGFGVHRHPAESVEIDGI